MPLSDLTLAELNEFRPEVPEPADFDAFWATRSPRPARCRSSCR